MKFFWNKLFDDRRNLLIHDNVESLRRFQCNQGTRRCFVSGRPSEPESRSREGTGPSAFERLVRGGSFNFFHTHRGGLSCFLTGFDTHLTQSITKVTPSSSQGRNVSEPLLTMYVGWCREKIVVSCWCTIGEMTSYCKICTKAVPGQKYSEYCALSTCWSSRTPSDELVPICSFSPRVRDACL